GLYLGLGLSQGAFHLSATRALVGTAGVILLFGLAACLSPVLSPVQILAWGGNLTYLGLIAGWTVADSLKSA
ncbi:MAG: hypothetical protein C4320_02770, partial [Armatimonadota bacterium]